MNEISAACAEDPKLVDKRHLTIVMDVVRLSQLALTAADGPPKQTLSRAAIGAAVLLTECTANSCLHALPLPSKLAEDLDRLPALAKLDFYLFAATAKQIDRACRETQLVAEVLKLRDQIAHPKPKRGQIAGESLEGRADYGATKELKVPYDTREWTPATAQLVSNAVFAFLKKFFLDWCQHSKGHVTTILVAREERMIREKVETFVQMPAEDIRLIRAQNPEVLTFLDLRGTEIAG